ncbi:unnamed protein product [Phytophthora lilii]|uniref:Unnamed protein product n=1 Tax=Phytophthora lilii TaxID=2077276 RepID=A0A9W6TW37_9STRA|nr:unnamed protein product [Phytophthora lilii]
MYITNLDTVLSKYPCNVCEAVFAPFRRSKTIRRRSVSSRFESFPKTPKIYRPAQDTIRKLLNKFDIMGVDHYVDHFIVYDFEAILKPLAFNEDHKTIYRNQHITVSVSVCNSLTREVRCLVNESTMELFKELLAYIEEIAERSKDTTLPSTKL